MRWLVRLMPFMGVVWFLIFCVNHASGQSAKEWISKAQTAFATGKPNDAIEYASKAIEKAPKDASVYAFRGSIYDNLRKNQEALTDFSQAIQLQPNESQLYQRRGCTYFKLGKFEESVKDFNKFIEMEPKEEPSHWQRGISFYYAREYQKGQRQFEGYQNFDSNDVENAVWRYLCMVPLVGQEASRRAMLKIGDDKRIPMRQIYDLFIGKLTPAQVLATAKSGEPSAKELNQRLFYAYLYIGLWYQTEGRIKEAFENLQKAANDYPINHYMWDVARVHRDLLRPRVKQE